MIQRIKLEQHEKVPWLNCRGFSWNIAMDVNHPNQEIGQFGWRFATAKIDNSGPFSDYNNVDRIITLLQGNGFYLNWGNSENNQLTVSKLGDPKFFPGDEETQCELIEGPVQVLNLMADRELWHGQANIFFAGEQPAFSFNGDVLLVFALQGTQMLEFDSESIELAPMETALIYPEGTGTTVKSMGKLTQPIYIASLTKKGS